MSLKPALFLTSALVGTGLVAAPFSAQAGGMTHVGNWGGEAGTSPVISNLACDTPAFMQQPIIPQVRMPNSGMNTYGFGRNRDRDNDNAANSFGRNQDNAGQVNVPHPGNFGGNRPLNVQGNFGPSEPVNVQADAPQVRARGGDFCGNRQNFGGNQNFGGGNHNFGGGEQNLEGNRQNFSGGNRNFAPQANTDSSNRRGNFGGNNMNV